ncbi:helix-turn-helix domain-containing protein [Blastococcus sp. LR1]|uniref:helix-turn-helix domain-containing protein n=1 Tax=Blastococcus sp. LR1 TaxID=2877000 RepID=UPI001CC90DB8|nr:helix-turn-helix domain-containing protein [Blastococcus sp. LR1]MCA0144719.1 helix-turn-helix domain-containing protein [Blastococcus sp. LR1]
MTGRDRLRELLDAVLDEDNRTLADMAGNAYASPFHFTRVLTRDAGEPPVAMRRRVMLERAAWELRQGGSVTDVAWAAGYESVEGFSRAFTRAFGRAPSTVDATTGHWLPAPNGIHFHPPMSLWVQSTEHALNPLTEQLVAHGLDDARHLLEQAKGLTDEEFRAIRMPGLVVQPWDGPEESIQAVLAHLVSTVEVWLASVEGRDLPRSEDDPGPDRLLERHDAAAPRWLAAIRDVDRRGGWDDRLIDALCEPPESFVLSSVVAHVLTYSAHRRQLARHLFRAAGREIDTGDPIDWLRARRGEDPGGLPC